MGHNPIHGLFVREVEPTFKGTVVTIVFILDVYSFHVAHVCCKQGLFPKKKLGFNDSFDVTKCLQQIEMPDLLHVYAQ